MYDDEQDIWRLQIVRRYFSSQTSYAQFNCQLIHVIW